MHRCAALLGLVLLGFVAGTAWPTPEEDEMRAVNARFYAAVNAHDLKAVDEILLDSPDLLWVVFGKANWGKDAVLKMHRF